MADFYFKLSTLSLKTLESSYVKISAMITSGLREEEVPSLTGMSKGLLTVFLTSMMSWVRNFVRWVNWAQSLMK